MKCFECKQYSFKLRRCKAGLSKPKTKRETFLIMKIFGPSYICDYSKWKKKILPYLS